MDKVTQMSGGVARAFWNLEVPRVALSHTCWLDLTDLFSSFFDHGPESGAKVDDHTVYHTAQVILARPKAAAM